MYAGYGGGFVWDDTTIDNYEVTCALVEFGDNTDYAGKSLETDPLYQLDAHLTRDFTAGLWGSLDGAWYQVAKDAVSNWPSKRNLLRSWPWVRCNAPMRRSS